MNNKTPEILEAFQEALAFWNAELLSKSDLKLLLPSTRVDEPLTELVKISKLIKAHTTKVGIIYEPTKLRKLGDASVNTVTELSRSFLLYVSVLAQLDPTIISKLFFNEIRDASQDLVSVGLQLVKELKTLCDVSKETKTELGSSDTNTRLMSVGKIWNLCDDIVKLIEGGKVKVLESKTRLHLSLIEDGLDEFAEWAENPEDFDEDDPFGLEDLFSDEEPPTNDEDEDEIAKQQVLKDRADLIAYSEVWLQKFKLVKLLFLSIKKSLPTIVSGQSIDEIYQLESVVSKKADQLIVELMLNRVLDEEVQEHATGLDESCFKIIELLKQSNKSTDRVKWCLSWEAKYQEFLASMNKILE